MLPLLIYGSNYGSYKLVESLRTLGQYYNAEIFKIVNLKDTAKPKILKVLAKNDEKFIELFQQEQELLIKFEHPGIPKGEKKFLFTVPNTEQRLHCLVMEWVEGKNLEEWIIQNGAITETYALDWLGQLSDILHHVHQHGFFHRDIKPSNIMCRPSGKLALIDFGTAREVTQTVINRQLGTVVYSLGYAAPEQSAGQAVPQSDFYALGRTFVYLLTQQHPDEFGSTLQAWDRETIHPVSPSLVSFLNRLMEESPKQRPQNTQQLIDSINRLSQNKNPEPSDPAEKTPTTSSAIPISSTPSSRTTLIRQSSSSPKPWPNRPIWPWFVLGALGSLILMGGLGCWWFWPNSCDRDIGNSLSCGEEVLTPIDSSLEKMSGIYAFRSRNYTESVEFFKAALSKDKNDPETVIYL